MATGAGQAAVDAPAMVWLVLTVLMTAFIWLPHVLERLLRAGIGPSLGNPRLPGSETDRWRIGQPAWADRAERAAANAAVNLAIFAPLILAYQVLGIAGELAHWAAAIFFFARAGHYLSYVAGIPVLRTMTFGTGLITVFVLCVDLLGRL